MEVRKAKAEAIHVSFSTPVYCCTLDTGEVEISTFYNFAVLWLVEIKYCDFIGYNEVCKVKISIAPAMNHCFWTVLFK